MGQAKREWERQNELGYSSTSNRAVCPSCIEDPALQQLIRENAESLECEFCGNTSQEPIALGLDHVVEHMAVCIGERYTSPENELPLDNESESGFAGEVFDAWELLSDVGFEIDDQELSEEIAKAFSDQPWCRRDSMILDPVEKKQFAWEKFKKSVKHHRRYTFWSIKEDDEEYYHPDYLPVGDVLAVLGGVIQRSNIVETINRGTKYWRVRFHKDSVKVQSDSDICPPRVEQQQSANRMSPPGIVMFYGAEDFETACLETIGRANSTESMTAVVFETSRDLRILDLAKFPPIPSFFAKGTSAFRHDLAFLYGFARDIAKPVDNDERQQIEYVPTQAFTEYVRYELKDENGKVIDGIRFKSSKNDKPCIVLFCGRDECIASPEHKVTNWMTLDKKTLRTLSVNEIFAKGIALVAASL